MIISIFNDYMYAPQSLQDTLFLMFYSGIGMLALLASIYLGLRRSNAIEPSVNPPKALRQWTAVFFITAAMSHVWWYVFGIYWLAKDRLIRNIVCIMLDHITLVPLAMALLLRMLQDRQRKIWPWAVTQVIVIGPAAIGIAIHNEIGLDLMHTCQIGIIMIFIIYFIYALVKYSSWLNENYADLDHKEVWQSLLFAIALFIIYQAYATNPGDMAREYLSQINTVIIIFFLLWRVETLQELEVKEEGGKETTYATISTTISTNIGTMLQARCEATQIYLQHDLTLAQLGETIGTNRTYLSQYFSQQGITYNAYVNRLRIAHFERLYRENVAANRTFTAQQLAHDCGFRSYSTFAAAFKLFNGQNVSSWMRCQTPDSQNMQ
ncbi:MAG: helix-turn-helix transcriptional regulator [Prevotella sp.]|nr:helix-turn-helix transcriptional regulator [Prevotella sp.]